MKPIKGTYNYYPDYSIDVIIEKTNIRIHKYNDSFSAGEIILNDRYFAALVRFALENGYISKNDLKGSSEFWYMRSAGK